MSCKRCSYCEIGFPLGIIYCPKCKAETWLQYGPEPTPGWENWLEDPIADGSTVPIIERERIVEYKGQYWLADAALDAVSYDGLRMVGTLVSVLELGDDPKRIYFELGGRAKVNNLNLEGWWITRIPSPEEMFAALDVIEGTDLDGQPTDEEEPEFILEFILDDTKKKKDRGEKG